MKFLSQLKEKDLSLETVLLRVDFNVERLEDSLRLRSALPTIEWLSARGAKIVLLSHRGRPAGEDPKFSLRDCGIYLTDKLGVNVQFLPRLAEANNVIEAAGKGAILMLENLRFDAREEANDKEFARELASLGTMYVNDAFAVSHRANASVAAITEFLPSYAGLLFEKEYTNLSGVMKNPAKPLIFIIGGAKIADKLPVIKNFWESADAFLLGGGPANTILKARGIDIQQSIYDPGLMAEAERLAQSEKVVVPQDWATGDHRILDIGPSSIRRFKEYIATAKTIIWNGPLGLFEDPQFRTGSVEIAKAIAESGAYTVVGGGETTELVISLGLESKFSFLSTAGGAMLEFLAGKVLPGVAALDRK